MGRCAFLYTRVYVPGGSQLLGVDGVDQSTVGSQLGEAGTLEFATFQILPPGETRSIVYRYQLPAGITPESYRLIVQRQAGIPPLPVTVRVGEAEPRKSVLVDGVWKVNEE
ncbi:MAG: hypothetical protein IPK16_22890 [Anaerolineales bacterium]|nr:hypothetical protein [Anaerolineales bacterium]